MFFGVLAITLALIVWKRPRLHWVRWLLLAAMLGLALLQVRHQAMLAIIAAMLLAAGLCTEGDRTGRRCDRRVAAVIALPLPRCCLVAVRAMHAAEPPENEANPWKLIAAVPPELRSQPVLNGYRWAAR